MYVSLRCNDFIALSAHGYEYLLPRGDNNRGRDLKRPKDLRFCPRRLAFSINNDAIAQPTDSQESQFYIQFE